MTQSSYRNFLQTHKDDMIKNLQELVKINSVEAQPIDDKPFGLGPYKALVQTLSLCERLGFKTTNLDNYVGYAEVGEGDETIGILTHLDVVPEGNGWTYPPFGGEVHDGKLYGRGASDNKSPAIASIYAVKALVESGLNINKKIRLIFGTNEETGFGCMKHYLKVEKPVDIGFTPDGMFPVIHGEKGILQLKFEYRLEQGNQLNLNHECGDLVIDYFKGGVASNSVPDTCEILLSGDAVAILDNLKHLQELSKQTTDFKVEVVDHKIKVIGLGKAAHASVNHKGKNAISHLLVALKEGGYSSEWLDDYVALFGTDLHGESLGANFKDNYGDLTLNVGKISVSAQGIIISVDIRYPISKKLNEVMDKITESIKDKHYKCEIEVEKAPIFYETDSSLIETLLGAYRDVTKDESAPITIGGGTYARAMNNIVAFGATFPGEKTGAHEADEFIYIDRLVDQGEIYCKAIEGLLKL